VILYIFGGEFCKFLAGYQESWIFESIPYQGTKHGYGCQKQQSAEKRIDLSNDLVNGKQRTLYVVQKDHGYCQPENRSGREETAAISRQGIDHKFFAQVRRDIDKYRNHKQ
jgi:hypothetical protein